MQTPETSDTINANILGINQLTVGKGPECKEQSPGLERPQGSLGLQEEGMDLNSGHAHGITRPGKDSGMAWSPMGQCAHALRPTRLNLSATLTISSQLRGGRTCSLLTAAGAPAPRTCPPANESEPCTGRATRPRKPEHFKHALPNSYHT